VPLQLSRTMACASMTADHGMDWNKADFAVHPRIHHALTAMQVAQPQPAQLAPRSEWRDRA
jgi:hypothetical protein